MTAYQVTVNDQKMSVAPEAAAELDIISTRNGQFHILKNQKAYKVEVESIDYAKKTFVLNVNGSLYTTTISDKYDRLIDQLGMKVGVTQHFGDVKAPMPGLVVEVAVAIGQKVVKGDKVLILEAMKMENVIKATGDGAIKAVHVMKGTAVEKGQLLIEIE
ncbi:MAG: biotin/lipoyl-containing protein [Saprospiraceae bacterium]|nr:biotin/lipoyl-containing protein [Saprospiraceae bacterium]